MNIKGKLVLLRAIEKDDLPLMQKWANDSEIQYQLGGWHFPTKQEDQLRWFNSLNVNSLHQRFAIEVEEKGLIGTANLVEIDWKNKHAFHGMLLGDQCVRGKGYGVDTVMAIMRYAFNELGLERLDGSMIEYNTSSLKMYLGKCGWKEEGRQHNWYFRQGTFWDRILVGVTRSDYYELVEKTMYWNE
jgi:RimJ/RimL family protein N-acetyltransferase